MENVILKSSKKDKLYENKLNLKHIFFICALFFILIIGRCLNSNFFFLFIIISLLVFILSNVDDCITYYLFLFPFSSILRLNENQFSFINVFFILLLFKMIYKYHKIEINVLFSVLLFFLYCILFSGLEQITFILKMTFGLLLIYYINQEKIYSKPAIMAYACGLCLASLVSLLKNYFPQLNLFEFMDYSYVGMFGQKIPRFQGLDSNPNYYSLSIVLVLSAIIIMIINNGFQWYYAILFVVLSVFGILSISKSFLLSYILLFIFSFFFFLNKDIIKHKIK